MEFRNLKLQYEAMKDKIDNAINDVIKEGNFISGHQVTELENTLAEYVGVKNCITCANGTDALKLALLAWNIGAGDAVFVPDFTFFASGEVVADVGATNVFVDVDEHTFNISPTELERSIQEVLREGKLKPKVIISVDLFGLPADYIAIRRIADQYGLLILEDGAQGFGGAIQISGKWKRACSFGDISTTSFFPAKPLGCYGDGGAIFTDRTEWADIIRSYKVHGMGESKYDNVRIGMNSRLDTIQAAIIQAKFEAFKNDELPLINAAAMSYSSYLSDVVDIPVINDLYYSSWAQYTIKLNSKQQRDMLKEELHSRGIPSMVYYQKPMHLQEAFKDKHVCYNGCPISSNLSNTVLSLPLHPYIKDTEITEVSEVIVNFMKQL